jgi:polyphosphate kinase
MSLLTSDERITKEVKRVFELFYNNLDRSVYRELMVSPFNTRRKFFMLIDNEITAAKAKKKAKITIKLNNLVDPKMIKKLYDASKAGVEIKLIIRGICSLVPGVKNQSENIEVVSIVDRFLEHVRLFIFHNNNDPLYFISSADWMARNLDRRIEVTTPIYDKKAQETIQTMIAIQLSDNQKARIIDERQSNRYVKNRKEPIRSQLETYAYFKGLLKTKKDS